MADGEDKIGPVARQHAVEAFEKRVEGHYLEAIGEDIKARTAAGMFMTEKLNADGKETVAQKLAGPEHIRAVQEKMLAGDYVGGEIEALKAEGAAFNNIVHAGVEGLRLQKAMDKISDVVGLTALADYVATQVHKHDKPLETPKVAPEVITKTR